MTFETLPLDLSPKSITVWVAGHRIALGETPTLEELEAAIKSLAYGQYILRGKKASLKLVQGQMDIFQDKVLALL